LSTSPHNYAANGVVSVRLPYYYIQLSPICQHISDIFFIIISKDYF